MLRMVCDLVSGTKIAVSTTAAAQIGRLIQNTARQLINSIRKPPTTGPSAIEMPTTAPQKPSARARSTRPVKTCEMIDSATGFNMEPPTACSSPGQDERLDVGGQAAHQRSEGEHDEADLEHPSSAEPVAGRPGQHQQRRQHQRVDVDHPLQLGGRGVQVGADARQGDVDDRGVHGHDQQAEATGHQDDGLAPGRQRATGHSCIHTTIVELQPSAVQGGLGGDLSHSGI